MITKIEVTVIIFGSFKVHFGYGNEKNERSSTQRSKYLSWKEHIYKEIWKESLVKELKAWRAWRGIKYWNLKGQYRGMFYPIRRKRTPEVFNRLCLCKVEYEGFIRIRVKRMNGIGEYSKIQYLVLFSLDAKLQKLELFLGIFFY